MSDLSTRPSYARPEGQMTAVMRALAPRGPKVLRVGVMRGAAIVDERVLGARAEFAIGSSERASAIVTSEGAPALFTLFERRGGATYLSLREGMHGRVVLATGATEVAALVNAGARRVKLDESARGKIIVGDVTFLFQFVAPPPPPLRARLPLGVTRARPVDWTLTTLAALSFLAHFGLVGGMYSDWSDPIVDEQVTVQALVELVPHAPPSPIEEARPAVEEERDRRPSPSPAPTRERGQVTNAPSPPARNAARSDAEALRLARDAEALRLGVLASVNSGPAVKGALDRSEIPPIDLTSAARANVGAERASGDLHMRAGDSLSPNARSTLDAIAGTTHAQADDHGKEATTAMPPRLDAQVGVPVATTPIANAERVIAALRPRFRRCYEKGLAADPSLSGAVTIRARVRANGEVESTEATSRAGLPDSVVSCLRRVVADAQFDPPGGASSTLDVPLKVVQQR